MDIRAWVRHDHTVRLPKGLVVTACAVVGLSWLLLVGTGIVQGDWMELYLAFLFAVGLQDWWRDRQGKPSMPTGTPRQRLASGAIALVTGAGGAAIVLTRDALPMRIAGGALVVAGLLFLYGVVSSLRKPPPPADAA